MLGALIGAGASLLGGLLNKSSADKANAANAEAAANNIALQREFAQNGIQWKVDDARKAGISPLYALGAPTTSFSPVSVGAVGSNALGNSLHDMGQDIGRAVNASSSQATREVMFRDKLQQLQLEGAGLDNDIKRATIASSVQRLKSAQSGPPIPIPLANPSKQGRLFIGGKEIAIDPTTSSAKDFEDRYGDDISWMTAPIIGGRDLYNHARQNWVPSWSEWRKRFKNSYGYKYFDRMGRSGNLGNY